MNRAVFSFLLCAMSGIVLAGPVDAATLEQAKSAQPRDVTAIGADYFTPGRFNGRTLLITGGARGIGRATAVRAAREGANVVIADILDELGEAAAAEIRSLGGKAVFVHADVRSASDCAEMVAVATRTYGGIDGVVNSAGVMDAVPPGDTVDVAAQRPLIFAPIHEATDEYWSTTLAVNATGVFNSMRAELRQLLAQNKGGAIVNIGSIAGLTGLAGNPAYVASKHAVTGLTRNAAIDYAPYGIRINSVNMAATETPMTDAAIKKVAWVTKARAADPAMARIPSMGKLKTQSLLMYADSGHRQSTPAEQASVILFLLSDEASNITGAAWATDGGWTAY